MANTIATPSLETLMFYYGTDKSHDDHKYVDLYSALFDPIRAALGSTKRHASTYVCGRGTGGCRPPASARVLSACAPCVVVVVTLRALAPRACSELPPAARVAPSPLGAIGRLRRRSGACPKPPTSFL